MYGINYSFDLRQHRGNIEKKKRCRIFDNNEFLHFFRDRYTSLVREEVNDIDEVEYFVKVNYTQDFYTVYTDSLIVDYVNKLRFIKENVLYFLIDRYLRSIYKCENQDLKLDCLLEFIMYSNRVHLFEDFNCRTFSVLILNRELIRLGFDSVILDDPNVFDFMNLKGLREAVKKGQENFKYFSKKAKIYENSMALNFNDKSYLFAMDEDEYLTMLQHIIDGRIEKEKYYDKINKVATIMLKVLEKLFSI